MLKFKDQEPKYLSQQCLDYGALDFTKAKIRVSSDESTCKWSPVPYLLQSWISLTIVADIIILKFESETS